MDNNERIIIEGAISHAMGKDVLEGGTKNVDEYLANLKATGNSEYYNYAADFAYNNGIPGPKTDGYNTSGTIENSNILDGPWECSNPADSTSTVGTFIND